MKNQRTNKLRKPEKLQRKAQNSLDAGCLAMKRVARIHAEMTVGQAVSSAAESYDCVKHHLPGGPADIGLQLNEALPLDNDYWDHQPITGDHIQHPGPHSDVQGKAYADSLNHGFYAGRRQREEEQWKHRYPAMFPVFLACKQRTVNWSEPDTHCKDWKEQCACSGLLRTLDVLDLMCKLEYVK